MKTLSDKELDQFIRRARLPREEQEVQVNITRPSRKFYWQAAAAVLLLMINIYLIQNQWTAEQSIDETEMSYEYLQNPTNYTLEGVYSYNK